MRTGDLDDLLNQPGDYPGAVRVRRLPRQVAPGGTVALETWDGDQWRTEEWTTSADRIREWISAAAVHGTVTPWTAGTGRRRKKPQPAPDRAQREQTD
ncbi:hypothetical protein [Yinghuangia sp. YIM S09857]|uniref:hypothetical protein n=1 Tax=Yinghuangia sp. YIM S09857 TaxID=3436929 RepID=UPI003F53D02C